MAVDHKSLRVEFIRASGPGGQYRNKRETGVRLTHLPTGLVAVATERRSQAQNRQLALERLREKLRRIAHRPKRRVPTRPPARMDKLRLEAKRRRGALKQSRRSSPWDVVE